MEKIAPFADIAINLSFSSTTGLRYRTLNCIECGHPIIERSGDDIYRITNDFPERARVGVDGSIPTRCDKCTQSFKIVLAVTVVSQQQGIPLYMQPQSIFLTVSQTKKLRDTYCMECGKAFYSVSDRIDSLSDNTIPFELLDPERLGPMEARCKFQHCKQRWSVMA